MQFPEIAYSSLTLHTVPWTFMKFNELACSFMSNNSLIHFYKKFQLLWTERCERCETSIVKSTRLSCCSSFKSLCINQSSNSCWVLDPPKTLFQLVSWACMQFLSLSEQLTRISQCLLKKTRRIYVQGVPKKMFPCLRGHNSPINDTRNKSRVIFQILRKFSSW